MQFQQQTSFSKFLNQDMTYRIYGHSGKPCLVFPSQDGHYYDFENFQMTDVAEDYLNNGTLQLFCVDSIDSETWSNRNGNPRSRIERHEQWYRYITEELLDEIHQINGSEQKLMVTGCSMGGAHSTNFFLRRPDLFDTLLSLSGIFSAGYFFGSYMDDLVYLNSPIDYMRNFPKKHPYYELYASSRMIFCVGQGGWEEDMLKSTHELQAVFEDKGIHAWFDYWGHDVSHDWPWWRIQFGYFLGQIFGDPQK